jgi:hypothetical protein
MSGDPYIKENNELQAEIAKLRAEGERIRSQYLDCAGHNAKLRAALEPFAKAAKCTEDDEADNYCLANSSARHELTIGDLRRAALANEQEGK